MNLSNVNNMRFNGSDVKLAKINGVIVYKKEEEDALLIARYTANASGVLPAFNDTFEGYEIEEVNNNGIYAVTIRTNKEDNLPTSISFSDKSNLLTVEYLNTDNVNDMSYMFYNCANLTSLDLSNFDTSKVTNMNGMFYDCQKITSLDLSNFDTSNVTNMNVMFYNCKKITSLDLSNFDTSNVTSMVSMFQYCMSLVSLDLSNFDTSNVTNMNAMFAQCWGEYFTTIDLSNFDTSNVTSMAYMFVHCNNLTSLDLSNFDTSNVTNMSGMFEHCNKLTELDSMQNIRTDLSVPSTLNQESILDVIDNLATVTTTKTLKMSATQLSWVSEDKIIEANNKGWTISA